TADPHTAVSFTDTLPAGLLIATPPNLTLTGCAAGKVGALASGETALSLTGASVSFGTPCVIEVDVVGATSGLKVNDIDNLSTTMAGRTFDSTLSDWPATTITEMPLDPAAEVTIEPAPTITKAFGQRPVTVNTPV